MAWAVRGSGRAALCVVLPRDVLFTPTSLFMTIFPLNPPKHPSHADICLFFWGDGTAICLYRLAMLSQGHTSRQGIPISLCGTPSTRRI